MTRIRTIAVAVMLVASTYGVVRGSTPLQTGTWGSVGPIADPRSGAAAVSLADGRTLIAGGTVAGGTATDTVVIYDPIANSFTAAGRLIAARVGHSATLLADGRVLVSGGTVDGAISSDIELFDPASGMSVLVATLSRPRTGHAAARLSDGTVLIVGGSSTDGVVLQSAELFNPANSNVASVPSNLNQRRTGASATTLIDGRVLVAGGRDGSNALASAELFYPFTQSFTTVDTLLSVPRSGHTALLLPHNGGVLLAGGTANGVAVATSDMFLPAIFPDPFSWGVGQFAPTGAMTAARSRGASGPAGEGYAFASGGGAGDAEHYRFATIETDKDDYAPGERAIITGSGWQPAEEVTLLFQEDPAVHDDYALTVTADAVGNIRWDRWTPEAHDLGVRFYLTAEGSVSRAQTTFTDAVNNATITIKQFNSSPPPVCGATQSIFTQGDTVCANVEVTFNGNSPFRVQWYAPGSVLSTSTPFRDTGFASQLSSPATVIDTLPTTASTPPGLWTVIVCTGNQAGPCPAGNQRGPTTFTLNEVANTPPVINRDNATVTVNEGQSATNNGTWSDVNAGDTVTLSASVGTVTKAGTNASGTWTWSFTTTDGAAQSQTVTITADDNKGGVTSTTFGLTVNNVAPTATFTATSPINEGGNSTLSLTSPSDPSSVDTTAGFTYSFACDGLDASLATTYAAAAAASTAPCSFDDNGSFTVKGRIFDKDDGFTTYQATVVVNNVAPTATFAATSPINEGSNSTMSLTNPSDPSGADATAGFKYSFACDGLDASLAATYAAAGTATTASCPFNDNGNFTVKGRIFDKDNGSTTYQATVVVNNVPPTAAFAATSPIDEGGSSSLSLTSPSDASSVDMAAGFRYSFACDGLDTSLAATYAAAGTATTSSCSFNDNGSFTVKGRIFDKDNGSTTYQATVVVNNVAPSATLGNSGPVNEGSAATVTFTNPLDPSTTDTTAGFHYAFACDNSSLAAATYASSGSSASTSCPFDDNGTRTVRARIIDKDDGFTEYTTDVIVNNVAPTATLGNNGPVDEGSPATISFTNQLDPSNADTTAGFHYAFSCNNGSLASATYAGSLASASTNCTFADNGTFTVKARIIDKDDGFTEYSTVVTVNNVAPTATLGNNGPVGEGSAATVSFSNQLDPSSVDTAAGFHYAFSCTNGSLATATYGSNSATSASISCTFGDNGTFTVRGRIIDKDDGFTEYTTIVIVNNVAPTASFGTTSPILEGGSSTLSLTGASDPSAADTAAGFHYSFACDGLDASLASTYAAAGTVTSVPCPFADNGSYTVKARIFDKDDGFTTSQATVVVNDVAPTASFAVTSPILEGGSSTLTMSLPFDPSSVDTTVGFHYSFACDGVTLAASYAAAGTATTASCTFGDNGSFTVKSRIFDKDNGYTEYSAVITVNNVAPVLNSLTASAFTAPIGSTITIDADYSDVGTLDTHTCRVNWDDSTPVEVVNGIKDPNPTLGSCGASRMFNAQGVYSISVFVRDDDGGDSNTLTIMVTIFDPEGGFVTGGGWIMSPPGAYALDTTLTGKANFGFVSKYKKGSSTPEGQTEFQFKAGDLNFHSSAYETGSLVVSNFKAQYKGTGTINGVAGFKFILTAYDGDIAGGGGVDRFRMKIIRISDSAIIYDNAMGASDDIDAASPLAIGGGSIVIHAATGKK